MAGSAARVRDLIAYAKQAGATVEGPNGSGHYVATGPNGERVQIACTPGDYRGDENCKAEMRRKWDFSPERPNAGRYRKGIRPEAFVPAAERVESKSAQYSRLVADHREASAKVSYLLSAGGVESDLLDAMEAVAQIEEACAVIGRRAPLRSFALITRSDTAAP